MSILADDPITINNPGYTDAEAAALLRLGLEDGPIPLYPPERPNHTCGFCDTQHSEPDSCPGCGTAVGFAAHSNDRCGQAFPDDPPAGPEALNDLMGETDAMYERHARENGEVIRG